MPGRSSSWISKRPLIRAAASPADIRGQLNEAGWNAWSARLSKADLQPVEGSVTGRILTADRLHRDQAIAPEADWPQWEGPHGDCIARETGAKLIEDLLQARLVWKSETATPAAPGSSKDIPRTMRDAPFLPYCGGGATPVIGDNKVFLRYTLPSGEAFDETLYKVYVDAGHPEKAVAHGTNCLVWRRTT